MRVLKKRIKIALLLWAILCLMFLTGGMLYSTIEGTVAYVQTTSVKCINTFSADGTAEPTDPSGTTEPTDPSQPTDPSESTEPSEPSEPTDQTETSGPTEPSSSGEASDVTQTTEGGAATDTDGTETDEMKTGDTFAAGPWIMIALASAMVIVVVLLGRPKRTEHKHKD